jgi:hypothetical protein
MAALDISFLERVRGGGFTADVAVHELEFEPGRQSRQRMSSPLADSAFATGERAHPLACISIGPCIYGT